MNKNATKHNNLKTLTHHTPSTTVDVFKAVCLLIIVAGFILFSISKVFATETTHASISYGVKQQQLNDDERKKIIKQHTQSAISDQLIGKSQGKKRATIIAEKKAITPQQAKSTNGLEKSLSPLNARYYVPEFSIYSADTYLDEDIDGDGYYRTFSVAFDVDVYNPNGNENSVIYAELYISTDGVNWEHYYTTDDFLIYGDTDEDTFEVITTFAEGYAANHYDILIDIYEVGYADIVATHSSNDNNALYALPLESANYDQVYVEEVIIHGGSTSVVLLISAGLIALQRNKRAKKNS